MNALFFLCVILEPFMPSFSAKVYEQLNIPRELKHETILETFMSTPNIIRNQIPGGHKIGTPEPIFSRISDDQAVAWKAKFAGKKN